MLLALPIRDDRSRVPLDQFARNKVPSPIILDDIGPQGNRRRIRHRPPESSAARGLNSPPFFHVPASPRRAGAIKSQAELKIMNCGLDSVATHGRLGRNVHDKILIDCEGRRQGAQQAALPGDQPEV